MSAELIQDYLQTQGLKLPPEAVQIAMLAAGSVMAAGRAEIEPEVLWYRGEGGTLSEHLPRTESNHALLRQIFMALDSAYSANPYRSAGVYLLSAPDRLVQLTAQGEPLEKLLAVGQDLEAVQIAHLAARSAQTGWLNQIDDVAQWLANGDLAGSRHRPGSQLAVPVYAESGRVLGVVYLEHSSPAAFNDTALSLWIGLALALAEPLAALLQEEGGSKEN
ncbi:GAF domain-containing protein [Eikenella sp. S3360]|uniref:GAF domain-containing protein n=1 Tax=Eikenella glucosivorans TaxID=2766967 RepID=A0ABS0NB46_9NEIS|nr:GAF domain-containing protein [Eikenella glucosivorans]MBH5329520.1 GAF domain-containing protein [Eikenella glucosivorans]